MQKFRSMSVNYAKSLKAVSDSPFITHKKLRNDTPKITFCVPVGCKEM